MNTGFRITVSWTLFLVCYPLGTRSIQIVASCDFQSTWLHGGLGMQWGLVEKCGNPQLQSPLASQDPC